MNAFTSTLHSINDDQRLYVLPCGDDGYTCLGFDVVHNKTRKLAKWLSKPDLLPKQPFGTIEAFIEYETAMRYARNYCSKHGEKCPIELTPQFIGLEGKRVEVTEANGEKRRFKIGKSTGWMPCHLEIERGADGGCAVFLPEGSTFHVIK